MRRSIRQPLAGLLTGTTAATRRPRRMTPGRLPAYLYGTAPSAAPAPLADVQPLDLG